MLEIIVVVLLCRGMGKMMRNKGRKPLLFQIMLVVLWILGEFSAPFMYGVISAIQAGGEPELGMEVYLIALAGAAMGAAITFGIASLVPASAVASTSFDTRNWNRGQQFPIAPPRDPDNPYRPPSF